MPRTPRPAVLAKEVTAGLTSAVTALTQCPQVMPSTVKVRVFMAVFASLSGADEAAHGLRRLSDLVLGVRVACGDRVMHAVP
jgi:hypothetical protein